MALSAEERGRRLEAVLTDRPTLMSTLRVADQHGAIHRLDKPTKGEREGLSDLMSGATTVVWVAARQLGKSTTALAHEYAYLYQCLDPVSTILATNYDSTNEELWSKLRFFNDGMPAALRREMARHNAKIMQFADTLARIRCLSSKSPAGARSGTYQRGIFDEVAYWYDAPTLWADLTSTMHAGPHSMRVIISTPNGPGGLFHDKVREARKAVQRGDTTIRYRFWRWPDHEKYRLALPKGWEPTEEEAVLGALHGLDAEQLYWRHEKIHGVENGIGIERFRREYPLTEDEGFQSYEGGWFDNAALNARMAQLEAKSGTLRIYKLPVKGMRYAIGADPSWANGGDNAVAQVLDEDGEQVAVYATDSGGEIRFAERVAELSSAYGRAKVLVEGNTGGAGSVVIRRLGELGIPLWHRPIGLTKPTIVSMNKAWQTTGGSKESACSALRQSVDGDVLTLNDMATLIEMTHFRMVDGHLQGWDGEHDDHVMALALAEVCRRSLPNANTQRGPRFGGSRRGVPGSDAWTATKLV